MLRRLIGGGVSIETRHAEAVARVLADPRQLEQVVMNLVVNARDAMPKGGTVVLTTGPVSIRATAVPSAVGPPAGRYAHLAVADTGVGMDRATQARIFEPFFTTKPAGRGTGLGLSTVYGIVKQSGGWIACDSAPGTGTTFHIHLPTAA